MRLILLSLALSYGASAQEGPKTNPAFERIKKLAGDWQTEEMKGVAVRYRVTAAGSAVVETLAPDTEHEMMTVYTLDGDGIRLTHYCALGNQPSMRSGKLDGAALSFACDGKVPNTKSHDDPHMHALTMTFSDDGRLVHEWTYAAGGKRSVKKFEFERKK